MIQYVLEYCVTEGENDVELNKYVFIQSIYGESASDKNQQHRKLSYLDKSSMRNIEKV